MLEGHNRDVASLPNKPQRVAQRSPKCRYTDFEFVTFLCFHAVCKAQRRCAKKVHVQISGTTELGIFEMVMFEVRDGVTHIVLACHESLLPDRLAFPKHPTYPLKRSRSLTDK